MEKQWLKRRHQGPAIYESIVRSTLLYGAKTWPITEANDRRLEAAHHRWLRSILHVSWKDKIPNKIIMERTRQEVRRPDNTGTDVGGCSRRSGRQRWLEETHCPMCCPARDGLRSKISASCAPLLHLWDHDITVTTSARA